MEQQYHESFYGYLSLVTPSIWRYLQRNYGNRGRWVNAGDLAIDWEAVAKKSRDQPWQIIVEQGLALCCGDLVKGNLYKPLGHSQDIPLAIRRHHEFSWDLDPQAVDQLTRCLLELGSIVSQRNILECLYVGTASTLKLLLETWPKGTIQLNREIMDFKWTRSDNDVREETYDGEAVGPLWELGRSWRDIAEFESMLDSLLEREKLDQSCGPGGTMLHALIIKLITHKSDKDPVKILLERRVNINVRIFLIESFVTKVSIRCATFMSAEN